jgi:hypothetical protein
MNCNNKFRTCLFLFTLMFLILPALRAQSSQIDSFSEKKRTHFKLLRFIAG